MTAISHPHIDQFMELVRACAPAYRSSTLSFVALLHENDFVILAARFRLTSNARPQVTPALCTANLRAAEVSIVGSEEAILEFIRTALSGDPLPVGDHVLKFLKGESSSYSAYHEHRSDPYRAWDGLYVDCLKLCGARRWDLVNNRLIELERELQPHGYRSLNDLMAVFDFGMSTSDMTTIDIMSEPIASISKSKLSDRTVEISVHLARALEPDQITLIIVDAESGGRSLRRSIAGRELRWTMSEQHWIGEYSLGLPKNDVLTCRVLYCGSLHDEVQLADLMALPNLRRTLVELADPGLQRLSGPLIAPKSNQEQNDFEAGIAVLLYMLGFDAVRVGGIKKLSEAADIFATTPSGRIVIVECTTAVLDPKDKIGKLLARLNDARERLSTPLTGFSADSVIGIIVIPKARAELGFEWKAAEQRGLIVLCRFEIEDALEKTRFTPNADLILNDWLRRPVTELLTNGLGTNDNPL